MSCQKASLKTINNSNNTLAVSASTRHIKIDNKIIVQQSQIEDPYVFTETVPNILPAFSNTQKLRTRLVDLSSSISSPINDATTFIKYTQSYTLPKNIDGIVCGVAPLVKSINTSNSNGYENTLSECKLSSVSDKHIQAQPQSGIKKLTNVCIVRPQQQQQCQLSNESSISDEIKPVITSPLVSSASLYTPTSSLWQTPLILDGMNSSHVQRVSVSNCYSPSLNINSTIPCHSNGASNGNRVNVVTTTTTAAMAKVAPIVVHTVPPTNVHATKLPPSKFHQNTVAQQLKKVEYLKTPNSKCGNTMDIQSSPQPAPPSSSLLHHHLSDTSIKHSKKAEHSSDTSANVVFRMTVVPGEQSNEPFKYENESLISNSSISTSMFNSQYTTSSSSSYFKTQNREHCLPALIKTSLDRNVDDNGENNYKNNIMSSTESLEQNGKTNKVLPLQEKNHLIDTSTNTAKNSDSMKMVTEMAENNSNSMAPSTQNQKKERKKGTSSHHNFVWEVSSNVKGAVAVIKMSPNDAFNDTNLMASASCLPYCLQQNWLNIHSIESTTTTINREERIIKYKKQLRHEAEQLLSIRSLQQLPLQLAKKRLLCVKRLLYKYNQQKNKNGYLSLKPMTLCTVFGCNAWCIEMASYCQKHIIQNITQQMFVPCALKFMNNGQCEMPVFDVTHNIPLCTKHSHKRNELNHYFNEQQKSQRILPATVLMPQTQSHSQSAHTQLQPKCNLLPHVNNSHVMLSNNSTKLLKRKVNAQSPLEKSQKRIRKTQTSIGNDNKNVTKSIEQYQKRKLSNILKRKSSTTSLESVTSNSHQSSSSSSSTHYVQDVNNGIEQMLAPFGLESFNNTTDTTRQNKNIPSLNTLNYENMYHNKYSQQSDTGNLINQFILNDHHSELQYQPQKYENKLNFTFNTNSNSNYTSSGMGSMCSIQNGDNIFTQDVINVSENTSVSSTDTGLGGLSEPEFMLNDATDADIRLDDDHLLEEHDLDNVLSSLPEGTFNELFATVRLDESDEIERAIEIADKNLKTLQQTIGSDLNGFLDFNDDILMDTNQFVNDTTNCIPSLIGTSTLLMGDNEK